MAPSPQLTVQCRIVGHASPRWKSASREAIRVGNNEVLSRQRADSVSKELEQDLATELGRYRLKFLKNVSYADDAQPSETAIFGTDAMGQRESLFQARGDQNNDDAQYRRVDVNVRIARSTQDQMPTKVVRQFERSTKSRFWYVSVGVSASVTAVAGFEFFRVKLRNWKGDEGSGSVVAVSGGLGLKYSASPYSWTEEASFSTPNEVGFDDFHGTRVRYTSAGLMVGVGYARSYITFYGMGRDAASLHVGGWGTGVQLSADLAEGLLVLDTVPGDYTIERFDSTEWNEVRSDWITEQKLSVYFGDAQWSISPEQTNRLRAFALKVATDIRTN
jgi:hypothetical protein